MYLALCALIFIIAAIHKPIRVECLIVSVALMLTWLVASTMPVDGEARYWARAIVATVAAVSLCGCRSFFGFYQASVYAMVVGVYALLAYDVAAYNHWLANGGIEPVSIVWGETYKGLIHGLVLCQLAGFIPIVWSAVSSRLSIRNNSFANLLWGKRG